MTRKKLTNIIYRAHNALHGGNTEEAHEILHEGFMIESTQSFTSDPEVQKAVVELFEYQTGKLGCGHTIGDLISGQGSVTCCGRCLQERRLSYPTGEKP